MQKHELLVPAGNMECLRQAVLNGADAVYLGCKSFGARKFAANFSNEEIVEAVHFCHLYGVRLYVTMNTLIKNSEVEGFISQIRFLHKIGVDAVIMQDFGMICLVREMFPNLEIHASTQANISSIDVCKLYHSLGVKRVVFSRELSVDEIDSISVPIEKEAFIHGALCISYSGCCLMSSMLGGRSGNRGECAGCCRMEFSLEEDGKITNKGYLLSTKELNTSYEFQRLLDSSIDSFKIEGRMKSPLYVGFVTRLYRRLIDGEVFDLEEEISRLKTIFNREFTRGRILGASDVELMNPKSPNHIGLEIGKVVDVTSDKIKIQLNDNCSLHQFDAIRFLNQNEGFVVNYLYDENHKLTNSISSIGYVDNKIGLKKKDIVCKTQDILLEEEFQKTREKKISVSIFVEASFGKELRMMITDGNSSCEVRGSIVEEAKNAPISYEQIEKQVTRLGDSPFVCSDIDIQMDSNIFIPVSTLNELRREMVQKMIQIREERKVSFVEQDVSFEKSVDYVSCGKSCLVRNEEQLLTCLELGFDRIYTSCEELYEKYKNNLCIYYAIARCTFSISSCLKEKNLVSDYSDYTHSLVVGNYSLNVTNIYTAYYLKKIGISTICLSVELNENEISSFLEEYHEKFGDCSFEILGYGRVENMIIKGDILKIQDFGTLIDYKNRRFPVYYDGVCTHILNWEKRKFSKKDCSYRFDFYDETRDSIIKIVNELE